MIDITHDKVEAQEEEVYELFLNGELTVELEEEQVTIDKLFWGNNIEYCFGDIDRDGSEELHIRDDVMYYAIKARDGILQIFYEGSWGGYEPIVTDEAYIDFVISFYDGNLGVMNRGRIGLQYIEYGGRLYAGTGNMGFNPCNVYLLEKGEFSEIGTGLVSENYDAEKEYWDFDYFWEGSLMTEEEYNVCLNKLIDTSKCIYPEELYTQDEILEILAR